jgi:hypothetical protein
VTVPTSEELVYRLALRAGDQPVRVRVNARALGRFGTEHGREEGFPIGLANRMTVEGDAVEEGGATGFGTIACGTSGGSPHGLEGSGDVVELWLPARGRATLTARFVVALTPPWPATDYRPVFVLDPYQARMAAERAARPDGEQIQPRQVVPPPLAVTGRRGIRIALDTVPATAPRSGMQGFTVPAGQPLAVQGSIDPPRAARTVVLRYAGPGTGGQLRDVAAVAVDDAGRFSFGGWRPSAAGYHDLWAFALSASPEHADDHFCPRGFTVAGDAPVQAAAPEVRLLTRTVALRGRRPRAGVVLACSAPPDAPCRGSVALRRAGARLGRGAFALRPGTRATVWVPLRARRRTPRRLTADAVVAAEGAAPALARVRLRRAAGAR